MKLITQYLILSLILFLPINVLAQDTDNDNIVDSIDIDDDNDGVLDITESPNCYYALDEQPTSGDRTAMPGFTVSTELNTYNANPINESIDGVYTSASNTRFINAQNVSGKTIYLIEFPNPLKVNTISFKYSTTNGFFNNATIVLQASNNLLTWTDLNSPSIYTLNPNPDEDGFSVTQNAAKYKYYRLRGVSGTTYVHGYGELQITLSDYKPHDYPKNSCSDDKDGDNINNHLDLDSDNDGCSDSIEAGNTLFFNNNITTYNSGTDSNNNGLLDQFEDGVSGNTNYTSTYSYYALNNLFNSCTDSDNDGIEDLADIDADNDGVLDIIESPNCYYAIDEQPTLGDRTAMPGFTVSTDLDTYTNNPINESIDGIYTSASNTRFINAQNVSGRTIYLIEFLNPLKVNTISFKYSTTHGFFNNATIVLQASNNKLTWTDLNSPSIYTLNPNPDEDNFSVTQNAAKYKYYRLHGVSGTTYVHGYGELQITLSDYKPHDYPKNNCNDDDDDDGDNINNHLDLDSDNDGCSDSIEAGNTPFSNNNITTYNSGTDSNNNGLLDQFEDGVSGNTNYTSTYNYYALNNQFNNCIDSDNDGIEDLADIDADNDGVLDIIESPNCYYAIGEQPISGDRTAMPGFTVSTDLITYTNNPINESIDGIYTSASNTRFIHAQDVSERTIYLIEFPNPLKVNTITFKYVTTYGFFNNATIVLQASNNKLTWTDLNNPSIYTLNPNPDEDNFSVTQNAAKYKYYRLRGVSGTTYLHGYGELQITLSDYKPHDYPKNNCSDDKDGDNINNHLDLDSDNDGCSDSIEAGNTPFLNNDISNFNSGADSNNNGLLDQFEDGTSGNTNYTSTYSYYALNNQFNSCTDSDNDGIEDLADIDADNDGVLDITESPNCYHAIGEQPISGDRTAMPGFTVSTDLITYTNNPINESIDGVYTSASNTRFTHAQNVSERTIYLIEFPNPLKVNTITFKYATTYGFFNNATIVLQASNNKLTWTDLNSPSTYTLNPNPDEDNFSVTQNAAKYKYYRLRGVSGTTYLHGYGELQITLSDYKPHDYPKNSCSDDKDGDNINNHLDLDSDNDGCSDSIEAGNTLFLNNDISNFNSGADSNNNGLLDQFEDGVSGNTNYTSTYSYYALNNQFNSCTDSDNDGIEDLADIDADNDGVLDITESPNCYYTIDEQPISGDRTAMPGFTVSTDLITYTNNPINESIDGVYTSASNTRFTHAQNVSGRTIYLIEFPNPLKVSTITFKYATTYGFFNNATIVLQASNNKLTWTDLNNPSIYTLNPNPDEDNFSVTQNAAKYKYYRLRGVSGTTYLHAYGELQITLSDYKPHDYPKNNCSDDNDSDNINNHLDLDSDNDGCGDALESDFQTNLLTDATFPNGISATNTTYANGQLTGPFGSNGLADSIESDDTILASVNPIFFNSGINTYINNALDANINLNCILPTTIDFDGSNNYLSTSSFISGYGNITLMAWVKPDTNYNSNGVITGQELFNISIDNSFTAHVELITDASNTVYSTSSTSTIEANIWHHITAVYNGNNGNLKLYINGKLESENTSLPISTLSTNPTLTNQDFFVGRKKQNNTDYFFGAIDEVRVFNNVLTSDQIQKMIYQEIEQNGANVRGKVIPKDIVDKTTNTSIPWTSLQAYYPMTAINSGLTKDESNYSRDLTLHNMSSAQEQTAPMPYKTANNGSWTATSTWLYGNVWDITDVSNIKDWAIVNIKNNVTTTNTHTNLGLIIDDNKKLVIEGDNAIINSWYLELNGTLDLLEDSQLIQNKYSDLVTSANGKIKRRQEGNINRYRYNYFGSPVGVQSAKSLINENTSSNNPNNTDFNIDMLKDESGTDIPFTSAYDQIGAISTRWLYNYINGTSYYDWSVISETTAINPGIGYSQKGTGNPGTSQQYIFEGKPNNGTILVIADDVDGDSATESILDSTLTTTLLANPYPSSIDAYDFIDDNMSTTNGTLYFWEQWAGDSHYVNEYEGGYATLNKTTQLKAYQFEGLGGNINTSQQGILTPKRYIAVAQGFFTEVIEDGNIIFNNTQRVFKKEANGESQFFRNATTNNTSNSSNEEMKLIKLKFSITNGLTRELAIGFSNFTTNEYDYGYDGKMNPSHPNDMYTILNNDKMIIQTFDMFNNSTSIPLHYDLSEATGFTIKAFELENIDTDEEVYLLDNTTGLTYDLKELTALEFSSDSGNYQNRFEVIFENRSQILSSQENTVEQLNIRVVNNALFIKNLNEDISNLQLISIKGQIVKNYKTASIDELNNGIDLSYLSPAVYIVQFKTIDNLLVNRKIIIE